MQQIEKKLESLLFEKIFEEIPDPAVLWAKTSEGKIILALTNKAALNISNFRINDFLGYSVEEFLIENKLVAETITNVMESGISKNIELKKYISEKSHP